MNRKTYLNNLKTYLADKEVSKKDIDAVITDYAELYDEATALNFSDEAVIKKLGSPKEIYAAIKDTLHFESVSNRNKIVAIMPFIATILFFSFGFGLDGFQYAWSVYLLIPVTAILVNVRGKDKIVALTPFISVIVFFMLGIFFQLWHPGWLIFLIIPVTAILLNVESKNKIVALLPFVLVITYILIGTYVNNEFYRYGFTMFALIPVLAIILNYKKPKDVIILIAILLAVAAHLFIYFTTKDLNFAWLPYLFPVLVGILTGHIQIMWDNDLEKPKSKIIMSFSLLVIVAYLLVSFLVGTIWTWSWIILLIIPMMGVYHGTGFKHPVAYMPFICVSAFMLLGTLGGYWNFAWMVFLLVPITAILTESNDRRMPPEDDRYDFDESSDN